MSDRRHLLVDLDGTLLGMDIDRFLPIYLERLGSYVGEAVRLPDFSHRFMGAVQAMIAPRSEPQTNERAFYTAFRAGLSEDLSKRCDDAFDAFYREVFPQLRAHTRPIPGARRFIAAARDRGYHLTLATSPVFPLRAIVERLAWAGIGADVFERITSFENCHFAKPDHRYYREVLAMAGCGPRDALMIGNDRRDDGAATAVSIPLAWVNGSFKRTQDPIGQPVWRGSMRKLAQAMEEGNAPFAR
ncbi:MAG: HAD family hydrolase [Thermaerobacter sp.]|nr:HAD family hydrolase [Thermaerobacter sp.]